MRFDAALPRSYPAATQLAPHRCCTREQEEREYTEAEVEAMRKLRIKEAAEKEADRQWREERRKEVAAARRLLIAFRLGALIDATPNSACVSFIFHTSAQLTRGAPAVTMLGVAGCAGREAGGGGEAAEEARGGMR